jgi:tetratricopeptide (TPR) repeat protein
MSLEGNDVQNHAVLVARFTSSGQWDRVLDTAREWLAQNPENSRAHLAAGQALLNLERYAEAESHLQQVLIRQPNNAVAHRFLSAVLFRLKRYKAADESIQRAISLAPHDAYNWFHLALTFYRQNDLATARKYAEKARELAPLDSDILNLLALCQPKDATDSRRRLREYKNALALDPENAEVHNNIGVYHMNAEVDFSEAEKCFRRALFFKPSLKVARNNLFIALKHRDRVYRILCSPKDYIFKAFAFMQRKRRESLLLYLLILPLWMLTFRFILVALALWLLFVWPLVKAYEYLTVGDIRTQAGEAGARRGGIFGYRRWPLNLRLTIFGLLLISFWSGVAAILITHAAPLPIDEHATWLGVLVVIGLVTFLAAWLYSKLKKNRFRFQTRSRAKKFDHMLKARPEDDFPR